MRMNFAPPVREIVVKFRNALYGAHYRFSTSLSPERHNPDPGQCQRERELERSTIRATFLNILREPRWPKR
jgi:hypothetical protein